MAGEARPAYDQKFLVERYKKNRLFYRIHEVFNPSLNQAGVTGKFYSPYGFVDVSTADPEIVQRIKIARVGVPKQKYPKPLTVNQTYGWSSSVPLVPIRKGDTRYYYPRNANISKINVTLKKK